MKNKALFAISSLGLGHATRSLTIIEYFLEKGFEIDIVSFSGALKYLKNELSGKKVNFIELQDYPPLERGNGIFYYLYLIFDSLKTDFLVKKENKIVKKNEKDYDFIFSDGRYGFYSKNIPCFLLSHQLSFHMPKLLKIFKPIGIFYNKKIFKKFDKIFIPDYEDEKNNLAGELSHPKRLNEINHKFIGILSNFYDKKNISGNEKIDYLFTITGYLKENKQNFLEKIIKSSKNLDGKKIFILGDYESSNNQKDENTKFFPCIFGEQKAVFFHNAKNIISRAGYTTIMDMVELDKKAILFPTKGQTEQIYLGKYLKEKKLFVVGKESDNLENLAKNLENLENFNFSGKTKEALEIIFEEVEKLVKDKLKKL